MIGIWPCPLPDQGTSDELCVEFSGDRPSRILVIPPLFDEHNKLRRQLVEVMRRLSDMGVASVLPDLPGTNESVLPLSAQVLDGWKQAIGAAINHFDVTNVLAMRTGCVIAPETTKGWLLAPQSGARMLRAMIRARIVASREAGTAESSDDLMRLGQNEGLTLAGWDIGPKLFRALETAEPTAGPEYSVIDQAQIGGRALWMRAEPDFDAAQADALATLILEELGEPE